MAEAVRISETSVYFNETTRRCFPEEDHLLRYSHYEPKPLNVLLQLGSENMFPS
jgi:hypothetical protein